MHPLLLSLWKQYAQKKYERFVLNRHFFSMPHIIYNNFYYLQTYTESYGHNIGKMLRQQNSLYTLLDKHRHDLENLLLLQRHVTITSKTSSVQPMTSKSGSYGAESSTLTSIESRRRNQNIPTATSKESSNSQRNITSNAVHSRASEFILHSLMIGDMTDSGIPIANEMWTIKLIQN